jgi:hypothetical protein
MLGADAGLALWPSELVAGVGLLDAKEPSLPVDVLPLEQADHRVRADLSREALKSRNTN